MYQIITDGSTLGYVDAPAYIFLNPKNGCYNHCPKEQATGLVFGGVVYNLEGTAGLGKEKEAMAVNVDGGVVVADQRVSVEQTITDLMIENVELHQEIEELRSIVEDK